MLKEIIRRVCVVLWVFSVVISLTFGIADDAAAFFGSITICFAFSACVQYLTLGTIDPRKVLFT